MPATRSARRPPRSAPPLLINNLVLVLGFWVGCFGSFKPTIYFSLLSGLTMITALLCDLYVTPACLVLLNRRRAALLGVRTRAPAAACCRCAWASAARGAGGRPAAARAAGSTRAHDRSWGAPTCPPPRARSARCASCGAATRPWWRRCSTPRCCRAWSARSARRNSPTGPAIPTPRATSTALEQAQKRIWSRLPTDERLADRRQKLWIDFVDAPGSGVRRARQPSRWRRRAGKCACCGREPLALLELSPAYVRRNLRLIAADAFHLDAAAVAAQLGPPR